MAAHDLDRLLAAVPFLAPLGMSVERADPGEIVLRLPADKRTRDFHGHVASAALFAAGELAATVALGTHPALAGRPVRRRHARIDYVGVTTRAVRARARLDGGTLPPEGPAAVDVRAELLDRNDAIVAVVIATFSVGERSG